MYSYMQMYVFNSAKELKTGLSTTTQANNKRLCPSMRIMMISGAGGRIVVICRAFQRKYKTPRNLPIRGLLVDDIGLDLHFLSLWERKLRCCRHPAGGKQMSTGHLQLDGFESYI